MYRIKNSIFYIKDWLLEITNFNHLQHNLHHNIHLRNLHHNLDLRNLHHNLDLHNLHNLHNRCPHLHQQILFLLVYQPWQIEAECLDVGQIEQL